MPFTSRTYSCGSLGRVRKLLNLNHGQANWVNVPVPQAAAQVLLDIETDPNNGDKVFVVGEAPLGSFLSFFGVAVSTNGGTTWNIPGGNYQAAVLSNTTIGITFKWNEIIVVNSTLSFIVGDWNQSSRFATIAMSTDGGLTYNVLNWQTTCTPDPTVAGLQSKNAYSVHFPNANIGVVGLNNFVIKTTDGGGTWTIMNGGLPLSTAAFPNPPGTPLPIGDITGIHIRADESVVTAIGKDFIINTEPLPVPAGMTVDSWRNNFLTDDPPGVPPIYSGFTPNLSIGYHLGGLQPPRDQVIWVSGGDLLGAHSKTNGISGWTVTPGIGWSPSSGVTRNASHFYKENSINPADITGFYNKSNGALNQVYWNPQGFSTPLEVLSDDVPGLNYAPNAIWTWYQETPEPPCFTLTDCADGSTVFTNVNLIAYINKVIKVSEFPGRCFVVTEGCIQPNTPQVVTYVADFVDCQTCAPPPPPAPCACPPGTVIVTLPDGSIACREDILTLAEGPAQNGCQQTAIGFSSGDGLTWGQSPQYGRYGARFYGETSGLPWPLNFNTLCTPGSQVYRDFSLATVSPIGPNVVNSFWGDGTGYPFGPYTGRFNQAGVTYNPLVPCPGGIGAGYYGFTHCLNVATTTTYCFGVGGKNPRILINGLVFLDTSTSPTDIFNYENWNVFQLTLPPGNYIILMASELSGGVDSCGNFSFNNPAASPRTAGSNIGMAFEIYKDTAVNLATYTSFPPGVLVYSTINEVGQPIDYGQSVYNNRCLCPPAPQVCPDHFGSYNLIEPILDNCTANPLNPNANPQIYVCHRYKYTPKGECCYLLTDCQNPTITYITSTDLSLYVIQNKIITVAQYPGCFIVSEVDCQLGVPPPPTVTVTASFDDCPSCLPKCYTLTDCQGLVANILTNTDLSTYVGGVINIAGSNTCWQVSLAQACQGSIAVTVTNSFANCTACLPVCYLIANCQDPGDIKITNTNLSAYLGQVIKIDGCPDTCWIVSLSPDCNGAVPVTVEAPYTDCNTCLNIQPPPPVELRPRMIKPGYTTAGCSPEYTEKVSCTFANAAYDQMVIKRYGITLCCNEPIEKWSIKKQLLNLRALYDPDLCKSEFEKCCPPCAVVATITVYYPVLPICPPPRNVVAVLNIPVPVCPPPTNVQAGIIINPTQPCICYLITVNIGASCNFEYTNCFGVPQTLPALPGINYICSVTLPTTTCLPGNYTIQTTPGDCLLGTCGAP